MFKTTTLSAHALGALALFVALGGTAIANDSVRALITGADVRNGSLTGRDVRNRSLTAADLAPGVLKAGPQGAAGAQGPAGERGERGPAGPDLAGATHVRVRGDRTPAENGEALRTALASITDASGGKPYVIQLAPGVYELGRTALAMKPDVSIVGAGAAITQITGDHEQAGIGDALMFGADRTLLRDVTITHRTTAAGDYHTVVAVTGRIAMRIEDAVLETGMGRRAYALVVAGASQADVRDSRIAANGLYATAVVALGSELRLRGSELLADGVSEGHALAATDSTTMVEHSALVSAMTAVNASGGATTIAASRITGDAVGSVTCVGAYGGSFAPLNASCS